jgi:hypothetical protein
MPSTNVLGQRLDELALEVLLGVEQREGALLLGELDAGARSTRRG